MTHIEAKLHPPTSAQAVAQLLNPTSIAVVGASESSVWATEMVSNILRWDFPGTLHMVHPSKETVYGYPAYKSLADIPVRVDHALIVVRAALVPDVLRQCASVGISAATVVAAGFAETGVAGATLAAEVEQICDEYGISLIGPNCFGFTNYAARAFVTRNWVEEAPHDGGGISMVFQSGQLNLSACGSAHQRGIDLRYMISSGNELVTDANDYFEYFLEDPETRVLGGGLERIPDPRRFERIALRALELGKPIVLLKLGTSEAGSRIATSHTGAVAGVADVVEAFLNDLGVIQVRNIDELVETAGLLDARGWPAGRRSVFIGGSGGAGEFYADMAQGSSIDFVELSEQTIASVVGMTGLEATALNNPMDLTASGIRDMPIIATLLSERNEADVIIVQGEEPLPREIQGDGMVEALEGHMKAVRKLTDSGAYAVFASSTDRAPTEFGKQLRRAHGNTYLRGKTGVDALSNAIDYGERRDKAMQRIKSILATRGTTLAAMSGLGQLSEAAAKDLLSEAGIPITRAIAASTEEQALEAASKIGYPIVLKIDSDEIAHKSEIGGVVLDIRTPDALLVARHEILRRAREVHPEVNSVLVCQQVSNAIELIVGAVHDPSIGPVLMLGAGGVYVELLDDVALAMPPVDRRHALDMLQSLAIWPVIQGARGKEPVDLESVIDVVVGASNLISRMGDRLVELDINPVLATPGGAWAADALIVMKEK